MNTNEIVQELAEIRRLLEEREDAFMTKGKVCEATTLSPREVDRRIKAREFPAPVALGDNRKAWPRSKVQSWIRALVNGEQWRESA